MAGVEVPEARRGLGEMVGGVAVLLIVVEESCSESDRSRFICDMLPFLASAYNLSFLG